jgi:hypothetical protein
VLPNPARDKAAVVSKSGTLLGVEVYDALGQLIWQAESADLGSVQVDLPVKKWSAGTYLIRASDENFVSCIKLITRP